VIPDALDSDEKRSMRSDLGDFAQRMISIVWPAFLVAMVAEVAFFAVFDPFELHFFGAPLEWSRQAIYALGFFGFLGLGIASSSLTMFFWRSPAAIPHDASSARDDFERIERAPVDDADDGRGNTRR